MPKLQIKNWYGFDEKAVNKKFTGNLTFINSFTINDEYMPVSVFKCAYPDKKKGHKKYVLIQTTDSGGLIRGMSAQDMRTEKYRAAIHCLNCDDVVFSAMRHDYSSCTCGATFADGGKDYFKYGSTTNSKIVRVNLLTGKIE